MLVGGRGRLKEIDAERVPAEPRVSPELIERFVAALGARDLDAIYALIDANATAELVGGNVMDGRDEYEAFFSHALMPSPLFGPEHPFARVERASYAGEPIVLEQRHWAGAWRLCAIHRLEEANGKISRIRCYGWCPDTRRFVGDALGIPVLGDAEGLAEALQKLIGASRPPTTGGYLSP